MPRAILLLLLLLAAPAAAQPRRAEPACTAPPGPLREAVCADPALREADGRLRALERATAAATSRPALLAHRARAWQRELEAGVRGDPAAPRRPHDREELADAYAGRIAALEEQLRQDRAMRRLEQARRPDGSPAGPVLPRPATLESRCLGTALNGCRVTAAGVAASEDGRLRVLWQQQRGFTEADGIRAGLVLLAEARGGWRLVGWSFEGYRFDPPRIVAAGGDILLHAAGRLGNTGTANTDLLFRLEGGGWREIETESWAEALETRLPAGLAAWNAVELDPEALGGVQVLSRDGDANCCPSGGAARLGFRIAQRRLELAEVQPDAIARAATRRPDACPAERATYRLAAAEEAIAELRGGWPGAGMASDLLLRVQAGGQEFWFQFAAAQGYGSLSLVPVEAPRPGTREDGVQALDHEDTLEPHLRFHPMTEALAVLPDPPRSGQPAPRHIFAPGLGLALHYGWLPGQGDRVSLPPAPWTLSGCRAE